METALNTAMTANIVDKIFNQVAVDFPITHDAIAAPQAMAGPVQSEPAPVISDAD